MDSSLSKSQPVGGLGTVLERKPKTKALNAFGAFSLDHSFTFIGSSIVPNIGLIFLGLGPQNKFGSS